MATSSIGNRLNGVYLNDSRHPRPVPNVALRLTDLTRPAGIAPRQGERLVFSIGPYLVHFVNIGAVLWHPRITWSDIRPSLAPSLLPWRRRQSAIARRRMECPGDGKGAARSSKAILNQRLSFRTPTVVPLTVRSQSGGKTDHVRRFTSSDGRKNRVSSASEIKARQHLEAVVLRHTWGRRIDPENASFGALNISLRRAIALGPTWKHSRSVRLTPQTSNLPRKLPSREREFRIGAFGSSTNGKKPTKNINMLPYIPEQRAPLESLSPQKHLGVAMDSLSVAGEPVPEQGAEDHQPQTPAFFPNTRSGVSTRTWSKPKDGSSCLKPLTGTLYLDGAVLSEWIMTRLSYEAGRPCTGIAGVDPRATPPWSVPNIAM